eukprot:m51a1_g9330 hypothetical protein (509) ;mRNA; f:15770-17490
MAGLVGSEAVDGDLMARVFPDKEDEKKVAWLDVLRREEFCTVADLRAASDDTWKAVALPLAVKDALRRAVAPQQAPAAPAAAAAAAAAAPEAPIGAGRPIAQIDVIAFDVSGSMKSASFEGDKTRAEMGKILFNAMIDKYAGAELPHAVGLLTFGSRLDWTPFTCDCSAFEGALGEIDTCQGSTMLYDAIADAARRIQEFRQSHAAELEKCCVSRVFVLTDGDDTGSKTKHWQAAAQLSAQDVVLDALPLAGSNKWLQGMCVCTSGLCLEVSNVEQGIGLFEREAVLRLMCRETPPRPPAPTCDGDLSRLCSSSQSKAVTDVKSALPRQATAPVLHGAYEIAIAARTAQTSAAKRVFKELKDLRGSGVAAVFVNADDNLYWKLLIEGPPGSPYEGCRWLLSVQFPSSYPAKPPAVRFLVPIYHCNVSSDGRICLDILGTAWNSALSVQRVVVAIKELMRSPSSDDPLDTYKATLFKDDRARYTREAREHSMQVASRSVDDLKVAFKLD